MAKLLRKGFQKKINCSHCGSRSSVAQEDVRLGVDWDGMGGNDYVFNFLCPACGKAASIPSELVPSAIKEYLYEKDRKRRNQDLSAAKC
ncbi:hypothetical protein A2926_03980 [Candidatus Giovannonibacteria bacterium RIFCSPLOWO2_01_FULL_44_40]|uniref:Uncharacterized protein n=1 Tax=Candidatus Giovannonibacteria bacterium RIFCSPHIGHO2_01_FULL_45_23 TaxID=1798325 RepID=A0A1F5VJ66_9BACT|nr:MAG: hypothetical protein A2834_04140 [Candidatus Giovannonibacteria bacterium RIFCSPHIGHO2_01_FULL_45_23]OGF75523.1 MAG: hypothetical protein A3C77_00655 [Candidatus Giovannonibacteria bacterium RIFCSPHIGHO2_02_FULL_45_13]OGF80150.1 MAG: hypothetical protein A2926_03980 [Candidatus Giovannonibacteria bacterium RIFCSPLOWO2_01_FULL_44_40]